MPHRRGRKPRLAFVELHPLDDGSGLPPAIFEREPPRLYPRRPAADPGLAPIILG